MDTNEKGRHGVVFETNFDGATIGKVIINNGTMTLNERAERRMAEADREQGVSAEQVTDALRLCEAFIWGNAAYGIAFCVCRDLFNLENNACGFERMLAEGGIDIPSGTVNSAMSRNEWMRYHVDRWKEMGAKGRALALRDEFRQQMENVLSRDENP